MALEIEQSNESFTPGSIGTIIFQRRLQLRLSQAQLAMRLGAPTSRVDIARLESAQIIMPSWIRLQQLAEALELSVSDLLEHPLADEAVRERQSSPTPPDR